MSKLLQAGDTLTIDTPTLDVGLIEDLEKYFNRRCDLTWPNRIEFPKEYEADPPWEGGWSANVAGGGGKIAKRIRSWARKHLDTLIDSYDIGWIGGLASRFIIPVGTTITVTNQFDWSPGDFSDGGSCFFGGRRQTWSYLHHLGGRAGKIYIPNQPPGRFLILDDDKGKTVAFNFYGPTPEGGAAMVQAALGGTIPVIQSDFRVAGSRNEPIYINKGTGYVLEGTGETSHVYDIRRTRAVLGPIYCEACHIELESGVPIYEDPFETRPFAVVCQGCYPTVSTSQKYRWKMARIVPAPAKGQAPAPPPKKKREADYSYTTTPRPGGYMSIDELERLERMLGMPSRRQAEELIGAIAPCDCWFCRDMREREREARERQ